MKNKRKIVRTNSWLWRYLNSVEIKSNLNIAWTLNLVDKCVLAILRCLFTLNESVLLFTVITTTLKKCLIHLFIILLLNIAVASFHPHGEQKTKITNKTTSMVSHINCHRRNSDYLLKIIQKTSDRISQCMTHCGTFLM